MFNEEKTNSNNHNPEVDRHTKSTSIQSQQNAVNIKKPEKLLLFGHTIIEFAAYFNRAISGKNRDSVLANPKIDK